MANVDKKNSQVIPMQEDKKEFHRIKYSLKMALRIINGTFKEFEVKQYGTSGFNFEDDNEMTTVECWYKPEPSEIKKIEKDLNLPFENNFQDVRIGAVIKDPKDIKFNETQTFYLFRVVVGRSFVVKEDQVKNEWDEINALKEKMGSKFHSIYINDEGQQSELMAKHTDYVSHQFRVFDKERCRLMYKVQCKVKLEPIDNASNENCANEVAHNFQSVRASKYCINDKAYFCADCDAEIHQRNGIFNQHTRVAAVEK